MWEGENKWGHTELQGTPETEALGGWPTGSVRGEWRAAPSSAYRSHGMCDPLVPRPNSQGSFPLIDVCLSKNLRIWARSDPLQCDLQSDKACERRGSVQETPAVQSRSGRGKQHPARHCCIVTSHNGQTLSPPHPCPSAGDTINLVTGFS